MEGTPRAAARMPAYVSMTARARAVAHIHHHWKRGISRWQASWGSAAGCTRAPRRRWSSRQRPRTRTRRS
ncbi:hypothetical protein BLAT2472_60366 [Burkholderia latens]